MANKENKTSNLPNKDGNNDGINGIIGPIPNKIVIIGVFLITLIGISIFFLANNIKFPKTLEVNGAIRNRADTITSLHTGIITAFYIKDSFFVDNSDTLLVINDSIFVESSSTGVVYYLKFLSLGSKVLEGDKILVVKPNTSNKISILIPDNFADQLSENQRIKLSGLDDKNQSNYFAKGKLVAKKVEKRDALIELIILIDDSLVKASPTISNFHSSQRVKCEIILEEQSILEKVMYSISRKVN